jgi:hypothetical protein
MSGRLRHGPGEAELRLLSGLNSTRFGRAARLVTGPGRPGVYQSQGHNWTLGCDARDPQLLAYFWAKPLGTSQNRGYDDPQSRGRARMGSGPTCA